jgi:hypothetical protein
MTDSEFNAHSEMDDFFGPRKWDLPTSAPTDKVLGVVVGGSLSKGLEVKLDRDTSTEDIRAFGPRLRRICATTSCAT